MRIVVTGGTGFIGAPLCRALQAAGHTVTIVGRRPGFVPARTVTWDQVAAAVGEAEAVVNLAGEPIAAGRWTAARKRQILDSRVMATRALVEAMAAATDRPRVLVSASAVGWYGPHGDEELDESAPAGTDFLAEVCKAWEAEAARAEPLGVRVVRLRVGLVLAPDGGALGRMLVPFRAGLGGRLGSGRQVMSWVHRDDVVGLIVAALGGDAYQGAVNATAPLAASNREFTETLARLLDRPAMFAVPAALLRLALGEMSTMLLTGQRVAPAAANAQGYAWKYPRLEGALHAVLEA